MSSVVVIGGGIVGASVAWHLKVDRAWPGSVTVLERDPSYAQAATALSASGLRQQFTTALNIRLSQYGLAFLHARRTPEGAAIPFRENGYLILAGDAAQAEGLRTAHTLQRDEGADVALLSPAQIAARYPGLSTGDLALGSLGLSGEGWFDGLALLRGLRAESQAAGALWQRAEAAAIECDPSGAAAGVTLTDGTRLAAAWVVNAAGTRAPALARTAGLALPVEPRKRTVFCFGCETPPPGQAGWPLIADPSGMWLRPEGAGFIAGKAPTADPAVAPDDFEPRSNEFDEALWPLLAARARCFEAVRMTGLWAGHYDWNTHDQNAILGPAPGVPGLLLATGFSGHGLQHGAGVGRGLAEWIAKGSYRSLDLTPLHACRLTAAPTAEANIY
ncbi:MAG: FAD-binding oxidoreductase [Pseudomonadota bacterium]